MIPTSVSRVLAGNSVLPMALVLWMLHVVASSGSVEIVVEVLDVLSGGDSTRPVGYCGHPWQEQDGGLLNGLFQC